MGCVLRFVVIVRVRGLLGCALGYIAIGSLGCALGVVGFVRGRWVHLGAPWGTSCSSGVAGMCSWGHRIRLWSIGSLGCALVVVGFVLDRWVHMGTPWESSGSVGVAGFIGFRPRCRRVRLGSLGSLWSDLRGRQLRSVSLGSLGCALGVVGFVWGRSVH